MKFLSEEDRGTLNVYVIEQKKGCAQRQTAKRSCLETADNKMFLDLGIFGKAQMVFS